MNLARQVTASAAAHAARMATQAPTSRRLAQPGPVTSREEIERRMADDMRDIEAAKGSVDETDLLNRGYTTQAVATYGAGARDRANEAAVRRAS